MKNTNNSMSKNANTNISKDNIDLIPLENKMVIDLHGLTVDETRALLDREFEIVRNNLNNNIRDTRVFVLLHGYSKGEVLKKYIRDEYKHKLIKYKEWGQNPGISYYVLRDSK